MEIIDRPLPIECYNHLRAIDHKLIVQHYFSCINVMNENYYDIDKCWELMRDLNYTIGERKYNLYIGRKVYASAHFFVGRGGEIIRLVPEKLKAYHAGKSYWLNKPNCNNFSIGIENICAAGDEYTSEQYKSNAWLCAYLMRKYNIDLDMIVGHEDVSPGRKFDPGEKFDWSHLRNEITVQLEVIHD